MALQVLAASVFTGCSSSDPGAASPGAGTSPDTAAPSPLSGAPVTPASPAGAGATPDRDPCATETNFITLVCVTDADCAPAGYCEPYPEADAGTQLAAPELAASSGPAGGDPACIDPAASDSAAASGPAGAPSTRIAAPAEELQPALSPDAGVWAPIGRCVPY